MDITALFNLAPAGKPSSTSGKAAGNGDARFAESLQAARASASKPAVQNTQKSPVQSAPKPVAAAIVKSGPGDHTTLALRLTADGELTSAGILQQLAMVPLTSGEPFEGTLDALPPTELNDLLLDDAQHPDAAAIVMTAAAIALPSQAIPNIAEPSTQSAASALPIAVAHRAAPAAQQVLPDRNQPLSVSSQQLPAETAAAVFNTPVAQETLNNSQPISQPLSPSSAAESMAMLPAANAATAPVSSAAITATSPALSSALGSLAWGQEFNQHLLGMVHRGEQQIDLYLHPRELGALSVSLSLDEQGARAQFFAAHGAVRSAVEQALPQLREALAQQGITLGETSVGDQPASGFQQQLASRQDSRQPFATSGEDDNSEMPSDLTVAAETANTTSLRGIDLYA